METLGGPDFRKVLNAIEILGREDDYATFPDRVVEAVSAAIDVDLVSYNEIDARSGASRFLLRPDIGRMEPGSAEYRALARRFGHHPIVAQRVSQTADGSLAGFVNRLRMLGMVGNCCGQAELRLNVGLTIASSGSRFVGVAINRSVRDFDDRDAALMELLKSHLLSAHRRALRSAGPGDGTLVKTGATADLPLTKRESEVLYWVSMGKTNGEVSEIIGARPLTVKKHLEHIYDKLGVPNRTAAVRATAAQRASV